MLPFTAVHMQFPLRPAQVVPASTVTCRHVLLHNIVQVVATGCWVSSEPCGAPSLGKEHPAPMGMLRQSAVWASFRWQVLPGSSVFSSQSPDQPPAALPSRLMAALSETTAVSGASPTCRCLSAWGDTPSAAAANWADSADWADQADMAEQGWLGGSSAGMGSCTFGGRGEHKGLRAALWPSRRRLEPRCPRGC